MAKKQNTQDVSNDDAEKRLRKLRESILDNYVDPTKISPNKKDDGFDKHNELLKPFINPVERSC